MKIFLCGYMGSGKSLVAHYLSLKSGFPKIDLDDQISLITEKTISEIFDLKGELFFRKLESKVLEDILEEQKSLIVALGGGTPTYGNNIQLIKSYKDARMIYLKASVNCLTERLYGEMDQRPLISHLHSKIDLEDFIKKHLFERSFYYNQADIIVDVDKKAPKEITQEILRLLK